MSRFHKFFIQELGDTIFGELIHWTSDPRKQADGSFSFYSLRHHFQPEIDQMARKAKAKSNDAQQTTQATGEGPTWVNVRFEQDEIQWITELVSDHNQIGTRLASLIASGVGFSVKWVPLRSNYSAFVVGMSVAGIGENCAFSAFAPDALTATCAVLCKIALITTDATRGTVSGQSVGIG